MKPLIVVTGAAGTLGGALVERLLADFDVIGVDHAADMPMRDRMAACLTGCDLTDEAAATAAFASLDALRPIDGLVNVAGGFRWETIEQGTVDSWDMLYRLNVRTALIASRLALSRITKPGGAIVNVGAAASVKAGPGMGAYAASKSAVARLTEALAEESKDAGLRVNAVLPSIIDTPINRADMPDADFSRWVTPAALADVIAFLLSPQAAAVTGALIPVTGRV